MILCPFLFLQHFVELNARQNQLFVPLFRTTRCACYSRCLYIFGIDPSTKRMIKQKAICALDLLKKIVEIKSFDDIFSLMIILKLLLKFSLSSIINLCIIAPMMQTFCVILYKCIQIFTQINSQRCRCNSITLLLSKFIMCLIFFGTKGVTGFIGLILHILRRNVYIFQPSVPEFSFVSLLFRNKMRTKALIFSNLF